MDARAWDERYAAAELVWSGGPNVFVASELADLAAGRAVDVATGEGRNALWLAARGWQVTAVDFSVVGLDKGRDLEQRQPVGAPAVTWRRADALTVDLPRGCFDLALLAYLQLAGDQRRTVVRRAFDWLVVGGTFLLVAHDATNPAQGTGGPRDPAVLYTAEEVLGDLDGERFEVVRAERVAREVATDTGHHESAGATAWDCLVRVVRTG